MKNKLKGITLLETLVYLSLFSVIILMILNFMLATQESTLRTERKRIVHQASEFVIQHLTDSFHKAQSIDSINSVFENSNGKLQIRYETTTGVYEIVNNRLQYNGVPITPPNTSITQFILTPVYDNDNTIIGINTDILLVLNKDNSISLPINMLFTLR
ncbi:hypothetical protein HYV12_02000 [Candidatus Dojkabacteria bacterium]|nr:hypothetical protein [Candidatus Dojkabacteria bacterium]